MTKRKKLIGGLFDASMVRELSKEITAKLEGRGAQAKVPVETLAKVAVLLALVADGMEKADGKARLSAAYASAPAEYPEVTPELTGD